MATTVDFTGKTSATIKNVAVQKKMYDAGALQNATDIQVDDAGNKFVLEDGTRRIQLYRVNSFVDIANGDSVKLAIETSEEAVYYKGLECEDLTVTLA